MMRKQLAIVLTALIFFTSALRGQESPATTPVDQRQQQQPPDPAELALAERFAQMAQANLASRTINDATLTEAVALLEAACKLNPYGLLVEGVPAGQAWQSSRFARLRAEACLSLRDFDGALEALTQASSIDPSDHVVQVQIIDLHASKMESADAKINYYKTLMAARQISPDVKARVGVRMAREYYNRGQETEANAALEEAAKHNQLDPELLELNELLMRSKPPVEHVNALMSLLRGNPAQPTVAAQLAAELAEHGLVTESAAWYANSVSLSNRMGIQTGPEVFLAYLSELMIANQVNGLDGPIKAVLEQDPTNAHANYLNLMLVRRGEDQDAMNAAIEAARGGFLERLYNAYRAAAQSDPPATQPTGELAARSGDVVAQAAKVKESGNPLILTEYAAALTDLAWLEIYFAQQPASAAPLIAALRALLPEEDARFARLEGWALLNSGRPDDAKVKLEAVAERDPLSAMGLILLASKDESRQDEVKSSAMTLVNENRTGLVGAMLLDGLRPFGAEVTVSEDGKAIAEDMQRFPKEWFNILDAPNQFYIVQVTPLQVSHPFDQAMYAEVSITNSGGFDISIGPNGTIRPDLWFDVNIRPAAGAPQSITGAAYDRLTGRLVLRRGDTLRQLVRLDQPKVQQTLSSNPTMAIQLLYQLVLNPANGPSGIAPGPAGIRIMAKRPMERAANPLTQRNQQMLQNNLAAAPGNVRIRTMTLIAAYANALLRAEDEDARKKGAELANAIAQLSGDPSTPVASWARFILVSMRPPEEAVKALDAMASSDYWPQRLLAAVAAMGGGEAGRPALEKLAGDAEPIIQKFAKAAIEDQQASATQPTTAPTDSPPAESPATPTAPANQPAESSPFRL